MSSDAAQAVIEMVNRETDAWNRKDAEALVALFHPDMVWPWPPSPEAHDPITWVMPMGRFNADRWCASWQSLFDSHDLLRNERLIQRVEVTPEGDGGFAVVDIDTVWRRRSDGAEDRWQGRVCKVYALCTDGWKMTMHTGVLVYD
jgi:ketosteroid isomerase-like protein